MDQSFIVWEKLITLAEHQNELWAQGSEFAKTKQKMTSKVTTAILGTYTKIVPKRDSAPTATQKNIKKGNS